MKKENNNYFKLILGQAEYCSKVAKAFNGYITDYNTANLRIQAKEMHDIEHEADIKKHEILEKLTKEFIAPIDREDILDLTQEIDNVVDVIEDVFTKFYIYDIKELRNEVKEYATLIIEGTAKLCEICAELENYRKSKKMSDLLIELNNIEEKGDRLYFLGIRKLFTENASPLVVFSWKSIIESLDNCLDCCERAADVIERVILKNS